MKKIISCILIVIVLCGLATFKTSQKESDTVTYTEEATVVSIQRLDNQIIRLETRDGNLWDEEFSLDTAIDIGDRVLITFEVDNDTDRTNDIVAGVTFIE